MIKAHTSGKMVSSGISDVMIASVYSEKPHLIIILNKSQEKNVFYRSPETDFRHEIEARKVEFKVMLYTSKSS